MPRVHSHYENLKVPRDASPEAIRAAWRRLAQRHHPDRRPGDAEAVRVMQLVNAAYDTLSDPVRRAEHDAWIRAREAEADAQAAWNGRRRAARPFGAGGFAQAASAAAAAGAASAAAAGGFVFHGSFTLRFDLGPASAHLRRFLWLYVALAVFGALQWASPEPASVPMWRAVDGAAVLGAAAPAAEQGGRAASRDVAPNGLPWPTRAAALPGLDWERTDGHGEIELELAPGAGDRYVRLLHLDDDAPPRAVRHLYLPSGSRFTLTGLTPGRYAVQQRELGSGIETRGAVIELTETIVDGRPRRRLVHVSLAPTR